MKVGSRPGWFALIVLLSLLLSVLVAIGEDRRIYVLEKQIQLMLTSCISVIYSWTELHVVWLI
jgi:hypothetical protein